MAKDEWEVVSHVPEQKSAGDEWGVVSYEPAEVTALTQNYVPRKTQGPARTVQGTPAPVKLQGAAPESGVMGGEDVWAPIVEQQQVEPKRESVMEGFKGTPPTVDFAENRRARDRSVSPESVMFEPARQLDAAEAQIYAQQYQDKKSAAAKQAARDKLRQDAAAEDYGVTNFLKDSGVDLAKGTAGLGEAYVGLLDITSGGAAGRVLSDMGYDPKGINKFLTGFQSITRKNQNKDVEDAQGFLGTLKELSVNPASLVGSIVESLPGTLTSGVAAGRYIRFLTGKASKEALAQGLVGAEAEAFIKDKVTQQTMKIAAVASGTEGAQTAGSIAEAGRQAGKDWNEYVLPALAAGFDTTAIGLVSGKVGKKFGIGDVETGAVGTGSFRKRFAGQVLKEGLLEELPQSAQEKIMQNIATGRPWDEGVDKASAQGLAAGMGMAAAHVSKNQAVASAKEAIDSVTGQPLKPRADGYQRDQSYEGLAELLAKSKGFLSSEQQPRQEQEEPVLDFGPLGEVRPSEELSGEWSVVSNEVAPARDAQVAQLAEQIQRRTKIPIENATRIAEERIAAKEKTEGAENARPPIAEPSGERTDLVEQPDTNVAPARAGVAEPSGVVPARQDVARVDERAPAQPVAVGFRKATKQEDRQDAAKETLELGNGAKVLFTNDGDGFVKDKTGKESGVLRLGDNRQGVFQSASELPEHVPEPVRQPLMDYQKALRLDYVKSNEQTKAALADARAKLEASVGEATKGDQVGTETTEAQQAKAQGQKAPAPAAPVVGKTLIDEFKDLYAQGRVTPEDAEKVQNWMKAEDSPIDFGRNLFALINEIERRPAAEAKVEEPAEEPIAEEDRRQAEYEAKKAKAQNIARSNASTAFDQVGEYANLDEALDSYRENMADTLVEEGFRKDPDYNNLLAAANRAFDEEVNKQKAPAAAPAEPPKKRGRPALERTEEQKQKLAEDKKQRKKDYDNADYQLKKLNAMLDEALKPVDEELEADKVDAAELDKEKAKKYVATQLLELSANPNLRGTAVGNRIKALLNDRSKLSQVDIDAAKRNIEVRAKTDLRGELGESFQGKSALASRTPVKAKPNTAFSRATNASQALTIVAKTGNEFQKALANRLRPFINGVTFVVLERNDPMPAPLRQSMETANGLYSRGTRTVYVKGESWGNGNGINNITVLHEILHAATDRKIELGKASALGKELTALAARVKKQYELMDVMGMVPDELRQRVEATTIANPDGTADYDIFKTPQEFLAYGMSDEVFQEFLGRVKSTQNETGFSSFVRSIYDTWSKAFGKGKNEFSAMSDLINITDKILDEKPTSREVLPARTFASEEPEGPLERTAYQLQQDTDRALRGVALSRAGNELGEAVSIAAALRDPRILWRETKLVWNSLGDKARTVISHAYDLEAIAKGPGEQIKSLQDLYEAIQKKNGMTENILRSAAEQSEQIIRFFNAHPKSKELFEDLVHASTAAEYDPSDRSHTHRDKNLDAMYNALPERGKELYKNLRDYNEDMKDFQRQIIADQIDKLELPADERDKVMAGIREIFEGDKTIQPYFPLMRYGDYVLEFGKGDKRTSVRFETKIERDRAALEYAKSRDLPLQYLRDNGYVKISDDIGSTRMRSTIEGTSKLLKAAYQAIDSANITEPGAKEAIKDNLYQAYLTSMPEGSVRKMFIHRKGTPGYSSGVIRNVNAMGLKMSQQFANLRYGPDIRNAVDGAYKAIEGDPTYKAFVKRGAELAANSLNPPEKTDLDKFYDSAAGLVTKAAYIRYMTSWSSAIMQPLDVFLRGFPMMLANHGAKGVAEMAKMLKFWNQYGIVEYNADGTTSWRMPSIERARGVTPLERRAIRDLISYGIFEDTLASTVFSQAKRPITNKALRVTRDVTDKLIFGGLMHHGERLSREFLGLASFRANMDKLGDYNKAIKATVDEVHEAFGNYSPDNRPLLMQGPAGKVITMYKFFPLVTYKNLGINFFKMIAGLNREEKVKAATKFFGVLGTHLLLGGLEALPLFTVVMSVIGALWAKWGHDPDAPDEMKNLDFITWWKTEFMPQQFGDEWSETLKKGLANRLTGLDIAGRISLDNMWFREPSSPGETNKDTFLNWALALGGPAPNLVISTMNGMQDIANGEYMRGLEKLTPGSISNYLTSYRYATEGIQTPQGVQLAEPGKVPVNEIIGQAIGYRPAATSRAQDVAYRGVAVERVINMEKKKLEQQYKDNFRKSVDPTIPLSAQERFGDKWVETLDKIIDFNLRNPTKQIDMDALNDANAENINKILRKETFGGIDINEKNVELLGPVSNEAEKALSVYNKP